MQIASIPFILIITGLASAADHWSYEHPEKWPGACTNGKFQSPINLEYDVATEKSFTPFQFRNYNEEYTATMKNNKHSVEVRLDSRQNTPSISGGGLPGNDYKLDHLHFHWKSEHTVNDRRFPLELHLVHFDTKHGNLTEAVKVNGGIVVLGIMFNISPDDDTDLEPLMELIDKIDDTPDKFVPLNNPISLKTLLPCDVAGFFRYSGSLTTPACNEVVTWTVFTQPLTLSSKQVKLFETIQSDEGALVANYRPLQKLNGRKLHLKRSPINAASRKSTTFILSIFTLLAFLM